MVKPTRRQLLGVLSGTLLAGCSSGSDGKMTRQSTTQSATTTTSETPTKSNSPLPYEKEWEDITVQKNQGWQKKLPKFSKQATISYVVSGEEDTDFDVYVFKTGFGSGFDQYKEFLQTGENGDSVTGETATDENADGKAETTGSPLPPGQYAIVVDYSNFEGGLNRAKVDDDSPETITVDISVEINPLI